MKFNKQRFWAIVKKEIIQLKRDKFSLRIPLGMPIMMMLLFGYAVNTQVDEISTVVFDQSMTVESREYIDKFSASGYFVVKYAVFSEKEMVHLIDSQQAKAGLIIPQNFAQELKMNRKPSPQLILDGSDPTVSRTALSSGILVSEMYNAEHNQLLIEKKGGKLGSGIILNTKVWYNPDMNNNKFTIPALVGLIMQNITIMLTAFALVREKERGTIEQLIVTPIRPYELIFGKLVPYIAIGYAGFLFSLALCRFWFGVNVEGSLTLLLLLGALFVVCALAMGMLISTFAKNQMQAMIMIIIIILPTVILSGFMFPIEAMPEFVQLLSALLPLTYFLNIIRGIVLRGVDLQYLWVDSLILGLFLVAILTIAIKRFRKSLD